MAAKIRKGKRGFRSYCGHSTENSDFKYVLKASVPLVGSSKNKSETQLRNIVDSEGIWPLDYKKMSENIMTFINQVQISQEQVENFPLVQTRNE